MFFQEARQLGPGRPGSTLAERLGNDACRRLGADQTPVLVALVAGRHLGRDVDAAAHRLTDRGLPTALDPLQLELGNQRQNSNRKTAHRRRAVEVVLDRDEPGAGVVQPADRAQRIDRPSGRSDGHRIELIERASG
jgi:hypothetical protein